MLPLRIEGYTRVLAEDQDEYSPLAIRDLELSRSNGKTANLMASAWEITPPEVDALNDGNVIAVEVVGQPNAAEFNPNQLELEALSRGASMVLTIAGTVHPPVCPYVCATSRAKKPTAGDHVRKLGPYMMSIYFRSAPSMAI